MGVGSSATGGSILVVNEQTTYQTWEFLYDPRVEQLKAAAALNSGAGSTAAGSLGQTTGSFGSTGGFGSTSGFGSPGGSSPTSTGTAGSPGTTGSSTPGSTPP
jgi:hypothetical protein